MPGMPPMPPMPPIPGFPAGLSSFSSTIIDSVVIINDATLAASNNALLTTLNYFITLVGSIIPFKIISQYFPSYESYPKFSS